MRLIHALLLLPLLNAPVVAGAAFAQTVVAETTAVPAGEHRGRRTAEQHFADANTSHDGRLTREQAAAGYKSIAKSFAQIDVNHHGYVTIDDIKAWKAARKAAKAAAKHEAAAADGLLRPSPAIQRGNSPRAFGTSTDLIVPAPEATPRVGVDLPNAPLDRTHAS